MQWYIIYRRDGPLQILRVTIRGYRKKRYNIPAEKSYKLIDGNIAQLAFPNVVSALRIFRSLMITNAKREGFFSKIQFICKKKIVVNCLRSKMSQSRLNSLAIEQNVSEKVINKGRSTHAVQSQDWKDLWQISTVQMRRVVQPVLHGLLSGNGETPSR